MTHTKKLVRLRSQYCSDAKGVNEIVRGFLALLTTVQGAYEYGYVQAIGVA